MLPNGEFVTIVVSLNATIIPMPRRPVVVIAPDSFKGSVSAHAAAAAIGRGLMRVWPDAELRICPMADGGEGTLDAILARGGERRSCAVTGAAGTRIDSAYGWMSDGTIVVIEAAEAVGLTDATLADHRDADDRELWPRPRRIDSRCLDAGAPPHDRRGRQQHQ
jgi:hypothetical protein